MSALPSPGLVVLYRWRLFPGCESEFADAWRGATEALLAYDSLGSRLHRGDDGLWYGYAQWPDAETRTAAFADAALDPSFSTRMRACILESFPEIQLVPVADLLRLAHNAAS
jgi:hypothetical protein